MVNANTNIPKHEPLSSFNSYSRNRHERKEEQNIFLEISPDTGNDSDKDPEIILAANYVDDNGDNVRWKHNVPETAFWRVGDIALPPEPLPVVDKTKLHGEARVIRTMIEAAHASAVANSFENATFYASGLLYLGLADIYDPDIKGQIIDQFVTAAQGAVTAKQTIA